MIISLTTNVLGTSVELDAMSNVCAVHNEEVPAYQSQRNDFRFLQTE